MANVNLPNEVSTEQQELSGQEADLFDNLFDRSMDDSRAEGQQAVVDHLNEVRDIIRVGARIARAQFSQPFGGLQPEQNKFGASRIRSGFFGYNSWEGNLTGLSAGSTNTWINDGKPDQLGGTDTSFGNPLKVGEEAVHVITGFGTYSRSPKVSAIDYKVNEEPRPSIGVKYEFTETPLAVKQLDRPLILPENSLFEAQVYADQAGDAAPKPIGVSFIKSRSLQKSDPADYTDDTTSTTDNVVAQG